MGTVVASYAAVRSGRSAALDRRAAKALAYPLGRRIDVLVAAGTDLGSVYGLAGCAAVLAATGRRRAAVDVALAGLAAWGGAQGTKPLIGRERPYVVEGADRLVAVPAGSSWPSGHVAVASAMAAALVPHVGRGRRRWLHLGSAAVAVSRCYVGVHHFTDVVAGWGVGVLSDAAVRSTRRRWARRRER
ncbi:phosphatase PAP2 family protein [Egicoccus halophilus]|uniref:phosphatase PAP2 family protein n=1 Tax=Egicoccus halophilus TaxID=1670830 RepID=UPI0013EE9066|nr:phosphatase PAP2 family protein [Egicoccus halophilus]